MEFQATYLAPLASFFLCSWATSMYKYDFRPRTCASTSFRGFLSRGRAGGLWMIEGLGFRKV